MLYQKHEHFGLGYECPWEQRPKKKRSRKKIKEVVLYFCIIESPNSILVFLKCDFWVLMSPGEQEFYAVGVKFWEKSFSIRQRSYWSLKMSLILDVWPTQFSLCFLCTVGECARLSRTNCGIIRVVQICYCPFKLKKMMTVKKLFDYSGLKHYKKAKK